MRWGRNELGNEYLLTGPFDLHSVGFRRLVALFSSFMVWMTSPSTCCSFSTFSFEFILLHSPIPPPFHSFKDEFMNIAPGPVEA